VYIIFGLNRNPAKMSVEECINARKLKDTAEKKASKAEERAVVKSEKTAPRSIFEDGDKLNIKAQSATVQLISQRLAERVAIKGTV
jgi:hypothetical protein